MEGIESLAPPGRCLVGAMPGRGRRRGDAGAPPGGAAGDYHYIYGSWVEAGDVGARLRGGRCRGSVMVGARSWSGLGRGRGKKTKKKVDTAI